MFNGKDFTGWAGPLDNYEVKDGAIVCKPKKGGNIYTKEEYGDFVARVEYQLPPGGNNGLAIRYPGKGQPSQVAMCEIQILDDDAPKYAKLDPRQYNGSVYGMVAGPPRLPAAGRRVELHGGDGARADDPGRAERHAHPRRRREQGDGVHGQQGRTPARTAQSGHFGFCGHSDPVAFRNIQIKHAGEEVGLLFGERRV